VVEALHAPLGGGEIRLVPLTEDHREPLRKACAADAEIWAIYPVRLVEDDFDPGFAAMLATPGRAAFAVMKADELVGTASYLGIAPADAALEIGGTYIMPAVRGTGLNRVCKQLMIDHAIACGYRRIEFRVDTRNGRSMAAVSKLGAVHEGVLRRNRTTWTGYVRDTAIFSLLAEEWTGGRH
jgi:RimJ/RimL family protein N-acetyltransferase